LAQPDRLAVLDKITRLRHQDFLWWDQAVAVAVVALLCQVAQEAMEDSQQEEAAAVGLLRMEQPLEQAELAAQDSQSLQLTFNYEYKYLDDN
jgi:hypothetical protein